MIPIDEWKEIVRRAQESSDRGSIRSLYFHERLLREIEAAGYKLVRS